MTTEDSFSFDPALMELDGLQGELVYDHKMLWRANLYIDENNDQDLNNTHPWVTGNAWSAILSLGYIMEIDQRGDKAI